MRDQPTMRDLPNLSLRRTFSRRRFVQLALGGVVGGAALAALPEFWWPSSAWASGPTTTGMGTTPEQVHLTWAFDSANNPTNSVVVTWLQPMASASPFVMFALMTNPTGLTNPGTSTVLGSLNTQSTAANAQALSPSGINPSGMSFSYRDLIDGEYVYAYSAVLSGLSAGTAYVYLINDGGGNTFPTAAAPGTFTTASTSASGRVPFRFTSYGDLATPLPLTGNTQGDNYLYTKWSESSPNAYPAVNAVEYFAPLFHLLNGDLCYADKNAAQQPEVWRDFGINVQRSAQNRPWMPCLGNHEAEVRNGYSSYLSRYVLPNNGTSFAGSFYSFQVGGVLFISLDANDVVYQDSAGYISAATASGSGLPAVQLGENDFNRYYTGTPSGTYASDTNLKAPAGNAQAVWLQNLLASARPGLQPASPPSPITVNPSIVPSSIDWIVVSMHQSCMSSSFDNGCDKGIRELFKPLFDQYQVDVVVNGHDHDYERSQPVRGYTPLQGNASTSPFRVVETLQPTPIPAAVGTTAGTLGTVPLIDTTKGTVYFVLGGGGTNAQDNTYQPVDQLTLTPPYDPAANTAGVHTTTIRKTVAVTKPPADAYETPVWSALTDPGTSPYGIAVFDVNPGTTPGSATMLTITYYHTLAFVSTTNSTAPVPNTNPNYVQFDQVILSRTRSDGPPAQVPEFALPAVALASAAVIGGATLYLTQRGPRERQPQEA